MELQNYYWCFQGALPHRICDDIVAYGKELKEQTGVTFGFDPNTFKKNASPVRSIDLVMFSFKKCGNFSSEAG